MTIVKLGLKLMVTVSLVMIVMEMLRKMVMLLMENVLISTEMIM